MTSKANANTDTRTRKPQTFAEFFELDGEAQQDSLMRMCNVCRRVAHSNTDADGNANPLGFADWLETRDDYITASAEAWVNLFEIHETQPTLPLPKAMFRACWNSLKRIDRAERKHTSALIPEGDDGEMVVDIEAYEVRPVFPNPAEYAVFCEQLAWSCWDDTDRRIVLYRLSGKSNVEIAKFLGISRQAVDKRLKGIYADFISR